MPATDPNTIPPEKKAALYAKDGRQEAFNLPCIIEREYTTRIRLRSFKIVTIVLALAIVIGASIPTFLAIINQNAQTHISVINTAGLVAGLDDSALRQYLDTNLNTTNGQPASPQQKPPFVVTLAAPSDAKAIHQQVNANKLDIQLTISRTATKDLNFEYFTNTSISQNTDLTQVQSLAYQLNLQDRLSLLGISQSQSNTIFKPLQFAATSSTEEQSGRTGAESAAAIFISMAAVILLFLFIQQYSSMVAAGVAEEKGSRIMEILVNATTPFQLLLGKIIGIGLLGLTQMGAVGIVGILAFLAQDPVKRALIGTGNSSFNLDITATSIGIIGLLVLYFILGYLLFAALYAAAGALVTRQEEVASSVAPLAIVVMVSYFISIAATVSPNADWVIPVSYIPFFTPMMMLARESTAPLAGWEILLSSLIMIVSILICTWIAARIYRIGILMYGQKPGFGPFFRAMRSQQKKAA